MAGTNERSPSVEATSIVGAGSFQRSEQGIAPGRLLACREVCEWPDQIADYRVVVSELLAAGADPNAENAFKETALLLVCGGCRPVFKEDLTIPRLLISHGADVKHVADGWNTALRNAAMAGNVPLVELLLEHGHPMDVGGGVDYTPLMMAARWGRAEVVQLLLERGADPNLVSRNGETALLVACEENHLQVVKALVAGGGDWKTPTAKGTLREIAERRKALDVVQYLDSLS